MHEILLCEFQRSCSASEATWSMWHTKGVRKVVMGDETVRKCFAKFRDAAWYYKTGRTIMNTKLLKNNGGYSPKIMVVNWLWYVECNSVLRYLSKLRETTGNCCVVLLELTPYHALKRLIICGQMHLSQINNHVM